MSRAAIAARLAPLALLALLAVAVVVPAPTGLRLADPDSPAARQLSRVVSRFAGTDRVVVIGFDPDLGTYAEIRGTVRALLADLLERGARLEVVSFTPEGRALAAAELDRLRVSGTAPAQLSDLGFRPGAEAALVRAAGDAEGLASASLAVVVGGTDLGPRSWVEQVATRLPDLPLVAVAPTVLHPELQPYLASGQLDALVSTLRDGAAYQEALLADGASGAGALDGLPVLAGMVVALGVLAEAVARRVLRWRRSQRAGAE
jgi:hypothetical protein